MCAALALPCNFPSIEASGLRLGIPANVLSGEGGKLPPRPVTASLPKGGLALAPFGQTEAI